MFDVILPFYGRADLITLCLRSLARCWYGNGKIFLVDDASPRHEAALVFAELPRLELPVEWISNPENRGFLASVNAAAMRCKNDYMMILNSDTILPSDCLRRLSDVLDRCEAVGAVAATSDNRSDLFQFQGFRVSETGWSTKAQAHSMNSPETLLPADTVLAPYLTAMCLGIRSALFRRLGCLVVLSA